jgi:hypothetical protein
MKKFVPKQPFSLSFHLFHLFSTKGIRNALQANHFNF